MKKQKQNAASHSCTRVITIIAPFTITQARSDYTNCVLGLDSHPFSITALNPVNKAAFVGNTHSDG